MSPAEIGGAVYLCWSILVIPSCIGLQQGFPWRVIVTVTPAGKPVMHELLSTLILLSLVLVRKLCDSPIRGTATSPAWQTSLSALEGSCTCFIGESLSKMQ